MNRNELLKETYSSAFKDELEKVAKIRVSDIEDQMDAYLPDRLEDIARDLIAKETSKRFAVRHPFIASLPTLGLPIWPMISKGKAIDKITRSLARKEPEVRGLISSARDARRKEELEDAKIRVESDKANQLRNAVAATATPLAMALASRRGSSSDE